MAKFIRVKAAKDSLPLFCTNLCSLLNLLDKINAVEKDEISEKLSNLNIDPVLQQAHSGHQGSVKMKYLLRAYCIWPGMGKDIDEFINNCGACLRFRRDKITNPFQPVADEVPSPWHTIGLDFTGPSSRLKSNTLFTVIDNHSRFPFAIPILLIRKPSYNV